MFNQESPKYSHKFAYPINSIMYQLCKLRKHRQWNQWQAANGKFMNDCCNQTARKFRQSEQINFPTVPNQYMLIHPISLK